MEKRDKINIETKSLASGKVQVKFEVENSQPSAYGYLLVNEAKSVGDIIAEIQERLARRKEAQQQINPFFPLAPLPEDDTFYLFSA